MNNSNMDEYPMAWLIEGDWHIQKYEDDLENKDNLNYEDDHEYEGNL